MAQGPLPPLGLYVHIPWCMRKCPYCDFNSHLLPKASMQDLEASYLQTLIDDLQFKCGLHSQRSLHSIFIGGGTPSLFSAVFFEKLLSSTREIFEVPADCEITMEANPASVEHDHFSAYRQAGINRISLGIQSFQNRALERIGRLHDGDQAREAIETVIRAGFTNFNIDLMHGLPRQSLAQAADDLSVAIGYSPPHISWYQLTIEPNTPFYSAPPPLPGDDLVADIHACGDALLTAGGYQRYEVSAYSKPGRQSRHNSNYWRFGDYLAIGAGAHGKLTRYAVPSTNGWEIMRYQNVRMPGSYLAGDRGAMVKQHLIKKERLPFEFMLNALRLAHGVPETLFRERTGRSLDEICLEVAALRARGLLEADRLQCTDLGYRFLNDVVQQFLPEDEG